MKYRKSLFSLTALIIFAGIVFTQNVLISAANPTTAPCQVNKDAFCYTGQFNTQLNNLDAVQLPKIATPSWLTTQQAPAATPAARQVTYTISTKGTVTASVSEFTAQVNETLNSPLGWSRLGVQFVRVDSGGQFTVWLAEASQMTTFSATGCDTIVSCTVGNNVIINQTRWLNGADSWNNAGGTLRDYRHMVVNHETGHWLGHGHEFCGGAGQAAPVMQQQTIDMQGCKPNPWPLGNEMYAPKLGIRS